MRTKDIDIEQFTNIEEVYAFLEGNTCKFDFEEDISSLFVKYSHRCTDDIEKQKANWESEFFFFEFCGARIFSLASSIGKGVGEVRKYPDLEELQQTAFNYLKLRAETTKNPILLARYNHLLWRAPKGIKNKNFALIAIDNYIQSIHEFYKLFELDNNSEYLFRVGQLFEILVGLCDEVKSRIEELKQLKDYLLFDANHLEFYLLHGIVEDMIKYPRLFKQEDFSNVLSIYQAELNRERKRTDDFFLVESHIPAAIKIAIKLGEDVKYWHNETGKAYLRIASTETEKDRLWLKLDAFLSAINAFKFAGNTAQKKAVEKLYFNLKPKVTLPNRRIEYSETEQKRYRVFYSVLKKHCVEILKKEPNEIYKIISAGLIFPKYQDVLSAAQSNSDHYSKFFTTIYFDQNKNITKGKSQDEDERIIYKLYENHISRKVLPYLHYIVVLGIISGKITFENFIRYLGEKTWLGTPFFRIDLGGEREDINWIELISPAICEYFNQILAGGCSKYYRPSYLLCIDSLTLKMEGLFRNFCELLNIPVSVGRNNSMKEEYMHNLLAHPTIKKFFNEDDLLFFNYLFSGELGMNLRNNVAHCFYNTRDYSSDKMLLLLAALLRIGKYNFEKK